MGQEKRQASPLDQTESRPNNKKRETLSENSEQFNLNNRRAFKMRRRIKKTISYSEAR